MPTRHGLNFVKKGMTWLRRSVRRNTATPASSTPCTWKKFLARSRPIVVISMADGSHCSWLLTAITLWRFDAVSGSHPPHLLCALRAGKAALGLRPHERNSYRNGQSFSHCLLQLRIAYEPSLTQSGARRLVVDQDRRFPVADGPHWRGCRSQVGAARAGRITTRTTRRLMRSRRKALTSPAAVPGEPRPSR